MPQLLRQVLHGLFGGFVQVDDADTENGGFQLSADGLRPFLADACRAVSHTENGADGRAVAVRIIADLDGGADGFAEIALSVEQTDRDDGGVGDRVEPAVGILDIVFLLDSCVRFLAGNAVFEILDHAVDLVVKTGCLGNLCQTAANNILHIIRHRRASDHRGDEHFAVNAVLDVGDAGIAERHFSGFFGIAGVDVAEVVAADLRADHFAVGILVNGGEGRLVAVDEVTERHALSGILNPTPWRLPFS